MEILLEQREFNIVTALGYRTIFFDVSEFSDSEFDSFEFNSEFFYLKKSNHRIKYHYENGKLVGKDYRGGTSEITPLPHNRKSFIAYFNKPREPETLNKKLLVKVIIKKTCDTAIISEHQYPKYDVYRPVLDIEEMFNELFAAGYETVIWLEDAVNNSYVDLLLKIKANINIDFVQACTKKTIPNADWNDLHFENGEWRNFLCTYDNWGKVRQFSGKNIKYMFQSACDKYRLSRCATSINRLQNWQPNDSRRVNFNVKVLEI